MTQPRNFDEAVTFRNLLCSADTIAYIPPMKYLPTKERQAETITPTEYASAYQNGFFSTVRFLVATGVPSDKAEEIAQAGWVRGWERRAQLRDPRRIVSWINRISLNLFRNRLRTNRPTDPLKDIRTPPRTSATIIDVHNSLKQCSPKECELLCSYYVDGYTSKELGRTYGCSPGAIRVRVHRARKHFVAAMKS